MGRIKNSDQALGSSYRDENEVIAVDINDIEEGYSPSNGGVKLCSQISTSEILTELNISCRQIWIQALEDNTGYIYFADAEFSTTNLPGLKAKDNIIINVKNPNKIYILSEVIGEGCKWRVVT